jgi:tripartite ATP-independent transporter DctM subunit
MESLTVGIGGTILLFLLLSVGVHIAISLTSIGFIGCAILFFMKTGNMAKGVSLATSMLNTAFFSTASNYVWVTLPLFILMGLLAAEGGLSYSAYRSASRWVGRFPGSLGLATIWGQTGFGTCTGSSMVTAIVFAKISHPEMVRYGYDKKFSYGLITAGGVIGMLIPPSVTIVVYGLLANESVGKLLIGGIGPGITMALIYSLGIICMVKRNPGLAPRMEVSYSLKEKVASLKELWPILVVASSVIGGMMWGVFTATEAGAIGSLLVFLIGILSRRFKFRALPGVLDETMKSTAMVFLVFIGATIFGRFLTLSGLAQAMITGIHSLDVSSMMIVVGFILLYLILGCFLDNVSMLATTVPLIHPIAVSLKIDPIWFTLVVIMACECGLVTPPVGMNVYAVKGVAGDEISLEDLFKSTFPFFLMMVGNLILLMSFPWIITWLPSLMKT